MPMTKGEVEHLAFTYAIKSYNDESPDSKSVAKFENELNTRLPCVYFIDNCLSCKKISILEQKCEVSQQGHHQQSAVHVFRNKGSNSEVPFSVTIRPLHLPRVLTTPSPQDSWSDANASLFPSSDDNRIN
jgi:hypothetical protein